VVTCWWCHEEGAVGKDGLCPPHHARDLRIKRTYGIGLEEVGQIIAAQGGWICPVGGEFLDDEKWVIDHDHASRRVRGILCAYHNHRTVGRHRDGDLLIRAGEYLNDPPAFGIILDPTVPKKKRKRAPKK
jgi:hypothetical protein